GGAADRLLVYQDHASDELPTAGNTPAGSLRCSLEEGVNLSILRGWERLSQRFTHQFGKRLTHKTGLPRARDTGDRCETSDREVNIHTAQIVARDPFKPKPLCWPARCPCDFEGGIEQIPTGDGRFDFSEARDGPAVQDLPALLASTGPDVN